MKTKAIAFLFTSICFITLPEKVIAQDSNSIPREVNKAVSDALQTFKKSGASGLTGAVSDCWRMPRDFCLYLDFASHRIAVGTTYRGATLDEYFYKASVSMRGHTWLKPNGRGHLANEQYLDAVDQVMGRVLITHRDKMFNGRP